MKVGSRQIVNLIVSHLVKHLVGNSIMKKALEIPNPFHSRQLLSTCSYNWTTISSIDHLIFNKFCHYLVSLDFKLSQLIERSWKNFLECIVITKSPNAVNECFFGCLSESRTQNRIKNWSAIDKMTVEMRRNYLNSLIAVCKEQKLLGWYTFEH